MASTTLTVGQIVSLTDGRLACEIDEVWDALSTLLDHPGLMTHELPRAGRFVGPPLAKMFPWTMNLPVLDTVEKFPPDLRKAMILAYMKDLGDTYGHLHEVPDLSEGWV